MGRDSHTDRFAFLAGGGEMGERTRAFDWSTTPVGPVAQWPQSLKTAVSICLGSRYPIVMWWGRETFTQFYNDGYIPILGVTKHPGWLGRPAYECWHELWPTIGPMLEGVFSTGEATWSEDLLLIMHRNRPREENYFTFSYSPIRDDSGAVGGVFCAVQETTGRVIGERRLQTLRDLGRTVMAARSAEEACTVTAQTLADNTADVPFALIYLLDDDDRFARLVAATGLRPGSGPGPDRIDLTESVQSPASWPLRRVLETGAVEVTADLPAKFGPLPGGPWPESPEEALVLPIAAPGQARPTGFLVTGLSPRRVVDADYRSFFDLVAGHIATAVANARAYEAEKRRAEALAEIDRAKTAFFSNVSHEFRTPLTLMLGPVEDLLARSRADFPAAALEQLEVVHRNGRRLLRLVNALLDFSRLEAGRVQAVYEPTDLAALTADLASVFRSACERAGLRLRVDCAPLAEPVFVDRQMWEKIVLNLLSNAFKFTFEGEIAVSLRPVESAVELRVEDTGTGIPAQEMPRLFERFHRVQNARGRTHEGSGIGLALVQELVKLHGGAITAESAVGRGSTFTIAIPLGHAHLPPDQIGSGPSVAETGAAAYAEEALRWLPDSSADSRDAPAEPELHEPPPTASRGDGSLPRVLIADDNADMRQYVVHLLAGRYSIETASDGEAALTAARERRPDLILTDVMMPRLDGFGLLRELRADPRTHDLPVIMLSARAGEESRVEGMEAGADDYLVKPFGARELLARVSSLLQMARLRREATAALRASEERLRILFETMSEGFALDEILFDDAGRPCDLRYLEMNSAFERHTGLKRSDLVGRTMYELFPEAESYWIERFGRVVATGVPEHFQARFGPLGRWFEVSAYKTGPTQFATVFFDVTDRKLAEESLAEAHKFLHSSLDALSSHIAVIDEAGVILAVNDAWRKFADDNLYSGRNYGIGANYLEACQPDSSACVDPEMVSGLRSVLAGQSPLFEFEYPCHSPSEQRWFIMRATRFKTPGPVRVVVSHENITARKLAEEALRQADRRKDEFIATLSHELRNPLAPIRNAVQIVRAKAPKIPELLWARDVIERQVGHMARLLEDLLDISRITRGKLELRKSRITLASVVNVAVETSRPLIDGGGHELAIALPTETVHLDADPVRLAQVFANLLNNAAKYSERGGRIRLTATVVGPQVVVSVRDSGIGIAPGILPHVFEMFSQATSALERAQGGLGIGLSLVKGLVEMHGGAVEARSDGPGRGSEFSVRLPLAAAPIVEEQPPAEASGLCPAGCRIVVADDNRDAAESLSLMLGLMGHEVRTANDGEQAIEVAEAFHPDVTLLDIGMPRLNGYEAARRIRERPWGRSMVLVALTGWGQDEDRRQAESAGFNFHFTKPVDPASLEKLFASMKRQTE